jgi:hypothetical protein
LSETKSGASFATQFQISLALNPGYSCSRRFMGMAVMRRGLDFVKAEAALKRAAYKAVHGTREERSGRFGTVTKQGISRHAPDREPVHDTDASGGDKWRKP